MNTPGNDQDVTVLDIRSRLEPFVDHYLIDRLEGARLKLHPPTPREVSLQFDAPWEGSTVFYVTVMLDGDRYRMYYRGSKHKGRYATEQSVCYAESEDGVTWTRPSLGICAFEGSADNNILWMDPEEEWERCVIAHNFMPFKDGNPEAPPAERYKAVAGGPVVGLQPSDFEILHDDQGQPTGVFRETAQSLVRRVADDGLQNDAQLDEAIP